MGVEEATKPPAAPGAAPSAMAPIELTYAAAAVLGRDRLPQLPNGLLARTPARVAVGDEVPVTVTLRLEALTIRAVARVAWVTRLATSSLVGMSLTGETEVDRDRIEHLLAAAPAGVGAALTPAMTPALPFSSAPVLSVAMLQPNAVLRHVLSSALAKLAVRLGERWTLRLEACTRPDCFLGSMADRVRHLAVVDCDAVPGAEEALVDAIRSHEVYARLPVVLLSRLRPPKLEDRYAVTLQKPLTVKSFLQTTELLLRA